ncbi:hypothetical protein MJ547_04245, partial [Burkholderia gladioli]
MHAYTAQDRALDIALQSAHVVSTDGSVSTVRSDYMPTVDHDGFIQMIERTPAPVHVEIALTLNGREHLVHLVRDEQRNVHLDGLQASGIASLWLTALHLFGLRFTFTKVQNAVSELHAWLSGEGKGTDVATFIDVITYALEMIAGAEADAFETKQNPFPAFALAA